ncbi:MAG TPA: serine/threonine-protein kinase [Lacipirellulaceae bacterium]|nr:serine/threonine-protein kinase [Lacipirellulaceae bacterium]
MKPLPASASFECAAMPEPAPPAQSPPGADAPPEPAREDSYPHIYVKDTDARFTTNNTTGFGRYSEFQPLAVGGSAVLRTCRDKNLGRTVVMKTLHPHLAQNDYMQSRFLREARVTAQLQHPTTVPVYDLGHDLEGRLYFTMKKVEGLSGREILDRQLAGDEAQIAAFDLERMLGVLIQVCNGLAYAHAHGVVHRDVKPENILVGEFGEVLVLDWGVAKVWADADSSDADERMQHEVLTDVNQRPGTPLYMSPEQVRGGGAPIDHRTDVYSVGAVLYELLTLSEPFQGKRVQETFEMIVSQPPEPPRRRAPGRPIPQALADIAMRALAKRPEDRYQTMGELINAVRDFRGSAMRAVDG